MCVLTGTKSMAGNWLCAVYMKSLCNMGCKDVDKNWNWL